MDLKEFRGGLETYPWLSAATTVFLANSTPPTKVRSSLTANMVTIGGLLKLSPGISFRSTHKLGSLLILKPSVLLTPFSLTSLSYYRKPSDLIAVLQSTQLTNTRACMITERGKNPRTL